MSHGTKQAAVETAVLLLLFFAYAGELPPHVNESHYLVKAKNFWQPEFCQPDLFASSAKAHLTFYTLFGWPTAMVSLAATAWIGRLIGWTLLAFGLQRLTTAVTGQRFASLVVAVVWISGLEFCDLAGEWVVGGIEAKVPAYGFVLLGLAALARRRWNRVWICLGAAAAFHVLTGGWSVVAALSVWWFDERTRADRLPLLCPALFLGGVLALFGLLPAVALTVKANTEQATWAAQIYTYQRIKHHLLPSDFHWTWYLRHGLLILATATVARCYWAGNESIRRLAGFAMGAVAIAAVGMVIGLLPPVAPDIAARLLRYYWFRLSDAMVPLLAGVLVARLIVDQRSTARVVGICILLTSILATTASSYGRAALGVPPSASNRLVGLPPVSADRQQQAFRDWLAVCRWAKASTPRTEVFLTPRHQQTFKWYAGRAEVVNWKDVPQDAASLIEWHSRFQEVYPRRLGAVRVSIAYETLRKLRRNHGVRYLIVDRRLVGPTLPLLQIYPHGEEQNETYAVYELPQVDFQP